MIFNISLVVLGALVTHAAWMYVWLRHLDTAHPRVPCDNPRECGCEGYRK